jgi:hypothetical protein
MQHGLGIVRVANRLAHTHDIAALLYKVLNVVVSTLIGKLGQFDTLACKLFVKVIKVQARGRQVLHAWQEHSSLQLRHGCFELRRNQC